VTGCVVLTWFIINSNGLATNYRKSTDSFIVAVQIVHCLLYCSNMQ
jgi:hypothetical protein